jgi:hypothetical protein
VAAALTESYQLAGIFQADNRRKMLKTKVLTAIGTSQKVGYQVFGRQIGEGIEHW